MLHIVMDSSGDMPPTWAQTYNIEIVPIHIQLGDQTFAQGVDLNDEDFYRFVDKTRTIPKTAAPSPHDFAEFYRRISQPGDTILSMHVSSKLSVTYASAETAARELEGELQVVPFDSGAGSAGLAYMCRDARLLEQTGSSLQAILKRMEFIRRNMNIIFTIDTLEYAHLSGRVKALQVTLSSLLNIKPIISLKDGTLAMAERVRTRQRALSYIISLMRQRLGARLVNAAVVHARCPDAGQLLLEHVRDTLNCKELILTNLSIAVSSHLGPGTVGIVAYPAEPRD